MSKGIRYKTLTSTHCVRERVPVSIYLVNGIKLQGQIESFDHLSSF